MAREYVRAGSDWECDVRLDDCEVYTGRSTGALYATIGGLRG